MTLFSWDIYILLLHEHSHIHICIYIFLYRCSNRIGRSHNTFLSGDFKELLILFFFVLLTHCVSLPFSMSWPIIQEKERLKSLEEVIIDHRNIESSNEY